MAGENPVNKRTLRITVGRTIRSMPTRERERADQLVSRRIAALPAWRATRIVLLYHALPDEVSVNAAILDALAVRKQVYLPRISGTEMEFLRVETNADLERMTRHRFGMLEPEAGAERWYRVGLEEPAVIVCPGRAFDTYGYRLGRGGGFYDRFLASIPAPARARLLVVGACYETQVVDSVPRDAHDLRMDVVATDERLITPRITSD